MCPLKGPLPQSSPGQRLGVPQWLGENCLVGIGDRSGSAGRESRGRGGMGTVGGGAAHSSPCPHPHSVLLSLPRVVGLMRTGIWWPLLMTSCLVWPFPAHLPLSDLASQRPSPCPRCLLVPQQTTCTAPPNPAPTSATSCNILPFPSRELPSLHPRPHLGHSAS